MQIEGSGFYYLDEDIANLGVPKFDGKLFYRFRIKNHNTHIKKKSKEIKIKNYNKKTKKMEIINNPSKKNITYNTGIPSPWNYSFFGITKLKNKPTASDFDLEERDGRKFPNINP